MDKMSTKRYKELYGSKPKKYLTAPSESVLQQQLFEWAAFMVNRFPCLELMYHIPNEGKRSITTGSRLKAEGLKAGVPDICLPAAYGGYHGLYIELKALGGTASKLQKQWITALSSQGYCAAICYGFDDAQAVILKYIGSDRL